MRPALRLATIFVAIFFVTGIHMPYFPAWLESRGFAAEEIGWILGVIPWMRVVVSPPIGRFADRRGGSRKVAVALGVGVFVSYGLFSISTTFMAVVAVAMVLGATFSPLIPLSDAVAVRYESVGILDYGRVRRWGSLAFIAATLYGGWILDHQGESAILWSLIGFSAVLAFTLLASPNAPEDTEPVTEATLPPRRRAVFTVFLVTTTLLHASHATLYGFGTMHWRAANIDESTIGWLWAAGVVAEILLFTYGQRLGRLLSATGLLAMAGVGGLLRWPLLASTSALGLLFPGQLLHALTFAALHLGAMQFIRTEVRAASASAATALYSATTGVALGCGFPAAGWLYDRFGGDAFFAMAILSLLGLAGSAILYRSLRR